MTFLTPADTGRYTATWGALYCLLLHGGVTLLLRADTLIYALHCCLGSPYLYSVKVGKLVSATTKNFSPKNLFLPKYFFNKIFFHHQTFFQLKKTFFFLPKNFFFTKKKFYTKKTFVIKTLFHQNTFFTNKFFFTEKLC